MTETKTAELTMAEKGRKQAVLFDMDGTLIDTECYYRVCWPKALAEFGYHMTDEQALAMRSLGRPFAPELLRKWFGDELDYAAVRARRKELMEEILAREGIRVKPGAIELLTFLRDRGIITAVVTATDRERADRYLERTGLAALFREVISATRVREGKPSPDIYLYACECLGMEPADCYAVEDSPNGIWSAYRAGCRVIMVPDQTQPDEELSACLYAKADTLHDIRDILGK
ncbi:MAG: HAD family phosphatase [Clostridium sp.]|nr:HAD family phosphatase [Acetatifactor muris]MCM1526290.1 HAD family phosphatase [Bacteroides sp.]MCM1562893.1 HAD family phosphatase [Clostridium sp.]